MAISNSMFPPIVNTYMPAFVREGNVGGCRIYFSFSPYQEISTSLPYAQIIVNNQKTNKNELNTNTYPMEIKRMQIQLDDSIKTDDKYYITVNASDLKEGFKQNLFYKVQIRIDKLDDTISAPNSTWLNNNLDNFSEWSTVCLIKAISTPVLAISGLDSGTEIELPSTTLQVAGNLSFSEQGEDETLKQYQLQILDRTNGDTVIADSGVLYSNIYSEPNQFNYTFKKELVNGNQYTLKIAYFTRNLYQGGELFNFIVAAKDEEEPLVNIQVQPDEENGRNKIYLISIAGSENSFTGKFIISRSDYTTNFSVWEDVHEIELKSGDWAADPNVLTFNSGAQDYETLNQKLNDDKTLQNGKEFLEPRHTSNSKSVMQHQEETQILEYKYLWCDNTPESGVYYKYRVQSITNSGVRTAASYSEPIVNVFDAMFILGEDRVLKIKYNANVSSYKYVTMDSKTDTIGGQFPFIKRNGNVYYRQLPISGLLTFLTDNYEVFTNRTLLLQGNSNRLLYQNYNDNNNITNYNNFIYERLFREEVIKFLQDGKPKLLKTLTEGNILVRLMDVNLSPEGGLNRYIYNFSAIAYEQANPTIENISKFNIQSVGKSTLDAYLITQAEDKIITSDNEAILVNVEG